MGGGAERYEEACVLLITENPAAALRVAEALSRDGRLRSRGTAPLKVYDCFGYFPPAGRRCSFAVTSVCGHLYAPDLQLAPITQHHHKTDHQAVFKSKARRVQAQASARLGVKEHLTREANGQWMLRVGFDAQNSPSHEVSWILRGKVVCGEGVARVV